MREPPQLTHHRSLFRVRYRSKCFLAYYQRAFSSRIIRGEMTMSRRLWLTLVYFPLALLWAAQLTAQAPQSPKTIAFHERRDDPCLRRFLRWPLGCVRPAGPALAPAGGRSTEHDVR